MSGKKFVPIRMPEIYSSNRNLQANQPQSVSVKKKFVPQRLKPEDFEDWSPVTKVRKVQESTKRTLEKKKFVPVRFTFTQSDFDDTPPAKKSKPRNQKVKAKTVKKELFSNQRTLLRQNSSKQTIAKSSTQTKTQAKLKRISELNTTESLIDINEAEAELLKKPHLNFKKPFQYKTTPERNSTVSVNVHSRTSSQKKPLVSRKSIIAQKENSISVKNPSEEKPNGPILRSSKLFNNSLNSTVTDNEFLEMERTCNIDNNNTQTSDIATLVQAVSAVSLMSPQININLNFSTPSGKANGRKHKQILQIFKEQEDGRRKLKEEFVELQEKIENFEMKCIKQNEEILEFLKASMEKENISQTPVSVPKANENTENRNISPLMPHLANLRVSTLRKNLKRTVAFDLGSLESGNSQMSADDIKLEKATTLYNSMRKNYAGILGTPKFDRICLQTPTRSAVKSVGKVKYSISRKLQKQCLLLQDTPRKPSSQ